MGEDGWGHQARWWAGEGSRRAVSLAAGRAPAATRAQLVKAVEVRDGTREIDLVRPGPHSEACLREEWVVAPAVGHVVEATDGYERTEGCHWPERRVYHLHACQVDLETSLVFHHGRVLSASGAGWRSARDGAFLSGAAPRAAAATRRWDGPLVPMGVVHNYYHFLIESLPRLLHIQRLAPQAVPVFAHSLPAFATSMMSALGIAHRVVVDPVPVVSDDLWLCEPVPTNWPHPADLAALRDRVDADVPPAAEPGPARVYVSRRRSSRSLHDEQALERMLVTRGFTIERMEDLSFAEQVLAVRAAEVVIAPHGAGLTNTAFCRPGTAVVEITAGDWWHSCFRNLASIAGLSHRLVLLPSTSDHPDGTAADASPLVEQALNDLGQLSS